ncbi:MAG TPA: AMP-binding protein [Jatrophihabitans sp.]
MSEDGYASRPWLRWYARGVPERVLVPEDPLTELLYDAARDFPRRKAISFLGRTMTYRALAGAVDRFAASLHALGVRKGDRVALILPNCPQNVIAFFAVLRLGGVVVQHNPLYTPSELHHQLADSGATVAIVYDGAYSRLSKARADTGVERVIVTSLADYLPSGKRLALLLPFGAVRDKREQLVTPLPRDAEVINFSELLAARHEPVERVMIGPEDLALLQYTGGTTGQPKGAMLTHRNLVANAHQAAAWDPDMQRGHETVLAALPMFHVYGLTMCLTLNMLIAGTLVLLPTFDLGMLFKTIDKARPTVFPGVPPMYDQIVRSRRTGRHDLSSIRACVSGAMRLPPQTIDRFDQITGGHLVEGYGLTESSPVALANPLDENARPGTIGIPVPSTDVRILDLDDPSQMAPVGVAGELCIRGPQVFAGYWNQPEESVAMLYDGWLHTGDIAVMDEDGFVSIVDRRRDVINASGFSVFPTEIEDVLAEHPAVAECAVAGVSHFYRGETVKAFVVVRPGHRVSEDELRGYCSARLVAYKVPALYEFRDDLPRNMIGKVLRRVLRDEHEAARKQAGFGSRPSVEPKAGQVTVAEAPTVPTVPASGARHALPMQELSASADSAPSTNGSTPRRPKPYVAADTSALIDELERLSRLRDAGALTDEQFEQLKARLLG